MDDLSFLHKIVVYRHFSYFQYGFQNGRQRSRDYFIIIRSNKKVIYIYEGCSKNTRTDAAIPSVFD